MQYKSGAVRALAALHKNCEMGTLPAWDDPLFAQVQAALPALDGLLALLPEGHVMAALLADAYSRARLTDGMTPHTRKLGEAAARIEALLNTCQALSLSANADAVTEAHGVLLAAVKSIDHAPLAVTRGDAVSLNNLGATVTANYPNGAYIEFSLRKSHHELDHPAMPEDVWVLEGGAHTGRLSDEAISMVEQSFVGPLPADIEKIVERHLRGMIARCCTATVVPLQTAHAVRRRA